MVFFYAGRSKESFLNQKNYKYDIKSIDILNKNITNIQSFDNNEIFIMEFDKSIAKIMVIIKENIYLDI